MKDIFFVIFFITLIVLNFTFAQDSIQAVEQKVIKIIRNIIVFLFNVFLLFASFMFIWLGIQYISGKSQIHGEIIHKAILYVVLGIILLILSFFIPNLIKSFLEIK